MSAALQASQQGPASAARRLALGPQWRCTATRVCLAPAAAARQAEAACRDQAGCSSRLCQALAAAGCSSSSSRGAWRLGAAPWRGSRRETTSGWLTCWVSSAANSDFCRGYIYIVAAVDRGLNQARRRSTAGHVEYTPNPSAYWRDNLHRQPANPRNRHPCDSCRCREDVAVHHGGGQQGGFQPAAAVDQGQQAHLDGRHHAAQVCPR